MRNEWRRSPAPRCCCECSVWLITAAVAMLITVYCVRRDLTEITFSLDVDQEFELENFRALCELESGIPAAESLIIYAEQPLTDNQRSLSSYGLKDGDVVVLRQKDPTESRPAPAFPGMPRIDFSSIAVPGTSAGPPAAPPQPRPPAPDSTSFPQGLDNPALLREMLLANPHELSLLKERNPPLAEALLSGDLEKFTKVLLEQQQERARREQERIRLFSADPFDLEAQAKIEEDIRQQNIEENMTIAMEEAPESFGQVVMLYINCKVNGYPVKAFVDSGAQMTIMSQACAERCHIMRLVDRRWAGIAKGVGTQKIIGRVHLAQVQIEGDFLPCSFSILEEQPMDMLLGLDMLKRHQCSIDLEKNVLVIGTTGTRTSFLPEGELPECARLAYGPGTEDIRPEDIADRELAEVLQKSAEEADKESTSEAGPSLVPPMDGSTNPVHNPDSIPPAHLTSTQSSAIESGDVACSSGFHPKSSGKLGQISKSLGTAGTDNQPRADSPASPSAVDVGGPGPLLAAVGSAGTAVTDADLVALKELGWEPHQGDAPPPSTLAPVEDEGREEVEAPCSISEDAMELDTRINSYLDSCSSGENITVQGPECQHMPCTDLPSNAQGSGDMDVANKKDLPKPPSTSGQDGEEHCLSLAAALKELHKLLLISGQGGVQAGDDGGTMGSETDLADVNEGRQQESGQNGELDNDLPQENVTSGQVTDETSLYIESETTEDSLQGSSKDDSSDDCIEFSSVPDQTLCDVVTGAVCNSDNPVQGDEQQPELSLEQSPSVQPLGPLSPAAVERIVGAGFTMQDALLALERADGNVELALLALLARNIVVPT
ncbi:uncharacterized protein [Engystomops pustulosus]|uniref:uncharacterized protein isoform X1 n=1 Tax=Engystomops pustulosus TaxID=76066 RepID=UPI003AFB58D0